MNDELKQQLVRMVEEDARVRAELLVTGELFLGYAPRMAEVHNRNAQTLLMAIASPGLAAQSGRRRRFLLGSHG